MAALKVVSFDEILLWLISGQLLEKNGIPLIPASGWIGSRY